MNQFLAKVMMEIQDILAALERIQGPFPKEAVRAAQAQREAMTPELLAVLEDTVEDIESILEADTEEAFFAHIFAMQLLAEFRETRAYPLVVQLLRLDSGLVDELLGDYLLDEMPRVLGSVCGGDIGPIQALIEDPELNEWVRTAALDALRVLVVEGVLSTEALVAYFRELFESKLEREHSFVWDAWAGLIADAKAVELADHVRTAYELGLLDESVRTREGFEREVARKKEDCIAKIGQGYNGYVADTVSDLSKWDCFKPRPKPKPKKASKAPEKAPPPPPMQKKPKIGPNERCPCGSGKKFKKCCGRAGGALR